MNYWVSWVGLAVGLIALAVSLIALGFIIRHEIRSRGVRRQVTKIALTRSSQAINALVDLLAKQVKAASDGFIPGKFDELFSNKAVEIISFHLDISKDAPVIPKRTWRAYLTKSAQEFQHAVRQILNEYSEYLPNQIIDLLAKLENSFFVNAYAHMEVIHQIDQQESFHRPPLLALEETGFAQDLKLIHQLVKLLNEEDKKCGLPGVIFPKSNLERQDVSPRLGCDRVEMPPKSSKN